MGPLAYSAGRRGSTPASSLPQLLAQKRIIDEHMGLLSAVMELIKSRRLDAFYELEEEILNKKTLSRPILEVLSDGELENPRDK